MLVTTHSLDERELATVLAALRYYQKLVMFDSDRPMDINNIATDCGQLTPLTDTEISRLCQRLNTEG